MHSKKDRLTKANAEHAWNIDPKYINTQNVIFSISNASVPVEILRARWTKIKHLQGIILPCDSSLEFADGLSVVLMLQHVQQVSPGVKMYVRNVLGGFTHEIW